jgi:hypothetical protein
MLFSKRRISETGEPKTSGEAALADGSRLDLRDGLFDKQARAREALLDDDMIERCSTLDLDRALGFFFEDPACNGRTRKRFFR